MKYQAELLKQQKIKTILKETEISFLARTLKIKIIKTQLQDMKLMAVFKNILKLIINFYKKPHTL